MSASAAETPGLRLIVNVKALSRKSLARALREIAAAIEGGKWAGAESGDVVGYTFKVREVP